jgi:predicted DNA-binding protein (UPF0251 family)
MLIFKCIGFHIFYMPRWRRGRRREGPGRPFSDLFITLMPHIKEFVPNPMSKKEPIALSYPEYNLINLIDLEGLTQEEAAKRMKTSRGTVWRLLENARKKIAQALVESRPLVISPEGQIEKYK